MTPTFATFREKITAPDHYRVCARCVMDTTDPAIQFDENGKCNHCRQYEELARTRLFLDGAGQQELKRLIEEIKTRGRNKDYDCVLGVSGGVDSTFVAFQVKKLGLRPLAVHLDNGWDSELAVKNVENVLKKLDIDLYTCVLDWEEFKDLQLSFLKASVPDAEIPSDHAIVATIYQVATERNIPYIVSGYNWATEGITPISWSYGGHDWRYIKNVQRRFGTTQLKNYPHYNLPKLFYYNAVKRIQAVRLLNYIPYDKQEAIQLLGRELGWKYYGGKHYESIYTRFFQGYILPNKFGFDKRKAHLSTLICSGQMTREEALEELKHNPYTEAKQQEDKEYVIKKLGLTKDEFERIMALPTKTYASYPTYEPLVRNTMALIRLAKRIGLLPRNANL